MAWDTLAQLAQDDLRVAELSAPICITGILR